MKSILLVVVRTYGSQLLCNYLRNKKPFLDFFSHFSKSTSKFEYFEKKITLIAYVFPKLRTVKNSKVNV